MTNKSELIFEKLSFCGIPLSCTLEGWDTFSGSKNRALEKMLTRTCILAKKHFTLSYSLDINQTGITINFKLNKKSSGLEIPNKNSNELETKVNIISIFKTINQLLKQCEIRFRFVILRLNNPTAVGNNTERILLLDFDWVSEVKDWDCDYIECLEDGFQFVERPDVNLNEQLASIPEMSAIVPESRIFSKGFSYPELLARHIEEMAHFMKLKGIKCEPVPSLHPSFHNEDSFSLQINTSVDYGFTEDTLQIRRSGREYDLSPIFQWFNQHNIDYDDDWNEIPPKHQCLYYSIAPWQEGMVYATKKEINELRKCGYIKDDFNLDTIKRKLKKAGFYLSNNWGSFFSGVRSDFGKPEIHYVFKRVTALVKPVFNIGFEVIGPADISEETGILVQLNEVEEIITVPPDLNDENENIGYQFLFKGINTLLQKAGIKQRFMVMDAQPVWYGYLLLFLEKVWVDILIAHMPELKSGLEDDYRKEKHNHPVIGYPMRYPSGKFLTIETIDQIISEPDIMESDFKCSSRETDFPELVLHMTKWAGLDVEVEAVAVADERVFNYDITVTFNGLTDLIRLENYKYARVQPIVDYINSKLDEKKLNKRLYRYDDGKSQGILKAGSGEKKKLEYLGYIR